MWDNREGKKNPKAPDYKCKEESGPCKWKMTKDGWEPSNFPTGAWMPKGEKPPVHVAPPQVGYVTPRSMGAYEDTQRLIVKQVALKSACSMSDSMFTYCIQKEDERTKGIPNENLVKVMNYLLYCLDQVK